MEHIEEKQEKSLCARLGWALLLVIIWANAWAFVLEFAYYGLGLAGLVMPDELYYMLGLVGHYIVSLPLAFLICRKVPRMPFSREKAGARRIGRWFVIGASMMLIGSWIGSAMNALAYSLAGKDAVSLIDEAFDIYPDTVVLLGACLIAPVCEEVLFRGLLAGRLARYGQKPGAFVSALLFGLFHANLSQFFYAFAIGILLAYAYYRTGSLAAPITLHILLNMYGTGVSILMPGWSMLVGLYSCSWLVLAVGGIVLLIRGRREQVWLHGPSEPSMRAVFGSAGMTLAIIATFVQLTLNFVLS